MSPVNLCLYKQTDVLFRSITTWRGWLMTFVVSDLIPISLIFSVKQKCFSYQRCMFCLLLFDCCVSCCQETNDRIVLSQKLQRFFHYSRIIFKFKHIPYLENIQM